jgi:hypothetical protein
MNLEVLRYILRHEPHHIINRVQATKYNPEATLGIAWLLLERDGDVDSITPNQQYHYKMFIEPIIRYVKCESGDCWGTGYVDSQSLLRCYREKRFVCRACLRAKENK